MTIADNLQTLINCKADMKSAIESKGVEVTGGLSTYADAIRSIIGSGGGTPDFTSDDFENEYLNKAIALSINSVMQRDIKYTQTRLNLKNAAGSIWQNLTGWLEHFGGSLTDGISKGLTFCPKYNTDGITNMRRFMAGNVNLMYVPKIDTSNVTNMSYMFDGCSSLYAVADLDTSKVTNMTSMFDKCISLTYAPKIDTSKVTSMSGMFNGCYQLQIIPQYDTEYLVYADYMLSGCRQLKSIPLMNFSCVTDTAFLCSGCTELTDIGGFKNLGKAGLKFGAPRHLNMFSGCHNITRESVLNIFNNLYDDYSWNIENEHTLAFEESVINRLSAADISIATNKGWTIETI